MLVVGKIRERVTGMPKIKKKPMKKAVLRVPPAKAGKATLPRVSAKKAAKRSAKKAVAARAVVAHKKVKAKPSPRVKTSSAKTSSVKTKVKLAPAARAKATAKARIAAPRTVILPPKSKRPPGRIAPLPPRTPSVLELPKDREEPVRLAPLAKAKIQSQSKPEVAAPVTRKRIALTKASWQSLQEAAVRRQRSMLTDEQRSAIAAAFAGRDSVVVIPDELRSVTCYELCVPLLPAPTVVLSPVLSELEAQRDAALAERRDAVLISADSSGPERSGALARIARGGALLVLVSPEALASADVPKALVKSGISLFVVEEAQCVSDSAHELRPSYAELGVTLRTLGKPPVMALARVATAAVVRDITGRLALTDPVIVQALPVRENVQLVTRLARGEGRQASLVRLVERLEPPGVVLCAAPHEADSVYGALRSAGISAHRYHAGMTPSERASELMNFTLPGSRSVMVAVSAFAPGSGMPGLGEASTGFGRGAGKRDVRFLVHYQSPASLEQYVREVERVGLDGAPATCVMFYESSHRSLYEVMLAQQRFRAAHLAELGRVLESAALEDRTLNVESLALATGQSRRTTDRLAALLADAGVITRTGGWVRVATSASDLIEACRKLGAKLYALREQDGQRLAVVGAFAETTDCKLGFLSRYLGHADASERCGRCSACEAELIATESMPPRAAARRPVVQEFSVRPANAPEPRASEALPATPLTAKLGEVSRARD